MHNTQKPMQKNINNVVLNHMQNMSNNISNNVQNMSNNMQINRSHKSNNMQNNMQYMHNMQKIWIMGFIACKTIKTHQKLAAEAGDDPQGTPSVLLLSGGKYQAW
jgi:translation elongation factor EF-Ts